MSVQVTIQEDRDTVKLLEKLEAGVRGKAERAAARAAGRLVQQAARERVPAPGYSGDKPGYKPLRDTIGLAVRDYDGTIVVLVGPEYPAGAHGHLVEFGHEEVLWGVPTGRRVPPHPFMRPAADETLAQQQLVMTQIVMGYIEQELR